jgi:DNA replication protein DnaC
LLRQCLEAEATDRGIRSIRYQINSAKFPAHRDLQGFGFSQSRVDPQFIAKLTTMEFTHAAQNLVLVGGTGTGKSHLATALAWRAFSNTANAYAFFPPLN